MCINNLGVAELQAESTQTGEQLLLYKRLCAVIDQPLIPAQHFFLQYKLPQETYPVAIELTSGRDSYRAYQKFAALSHTEFTNLQLVMRCRQASWTQQLTPRGLDLHNRTAIYRHLTGLYLAGTIDLDKFSGLTTLSLPLLRQAVYKLLDPDEQAKQGQLLVKRRKHVPKPEKLYKEGVISLQAFAEAKYPELAVQRLARTAVYPPPQQPATCIVCAEHSATTQCSECSNRICPQCAVTVGVEAPLLFHRIHCLRFGVSSALRIPQHARPQLPILQIRHRQEAHGD